MSLSPSVPSGSLAPPLGARLSLAGRAGQRLHSVGRSQAPPTRGGTTKGRVSMASVLAALAAAALVTAAPALAEPAGVGPPSSIASTGDSITRAFNTCWFPYVDCPSNSWSTGTATWTHYRRILAVNPAISGRTSNHAVTGADMAD